jgi:hypothetical protein
VGSDLGYLQELCCVCGRGVNLPAVCGCPCNAWRTCGRSACWFQIPAEHRDGGCAGAPASEKDETGARHGG